MKVSVPLTSDGLLADEYGKYAPQMDMLKGHPIKSFPLTITDAPAQTVSFALTLIDFDSVPVCGFAWIHWLVANIPISLATLPSDASRDLADHFIQGKNSNAGSLINGDPAITVGYVGPQPPNETHNYTLTVYALDNILNLDNGYWFNDFRRLLKGHVLSTAIIDLPSRS